MHPQNFMIFGTCKQ